MVCKGERVIEGTINEKLPDDFQTAEFYWKKGFIDKDSTKKRFKTSNNFSFKNA